MLECPKCGNLDILWVDGAKPYYECLACNHREPDRDDVKRCACGAPTLTAKLDTCADCAMLGAYEAHTEPQPCPNHDRVGCSLCFAADLVGPEPLMVSPSGYEYF